MPSNIINSPFSTSIPPGHGEVVLSILPPGIPSISILSYRYPLKLISRIPACRLDSKYPASATRPVHLYLLSYGGGFLPGDHIEVSIKLQPRSRLVVTTPQGSTKIYKTESQAERDKRTVPGSKLDRSQQIINVELSAESGLCYLPDPAVPFEKSRYEQIQRFTLLEGEDLSRTTAPSAKDGEKDKSCHLASLCVLDWVTEGRSARGENWAFDLWEGRNEVWVRDCKTGKTRLLVRDTVILSDETSASNENDTPNGDIRQHKRQAQFSATPLPISSRTAPHGVLGTLILYGPLFDSLSACFMEEFSSMPRIGNRYGPSSQPAHETGTSKTSNVTWTAARVRSRFVIVKFGAPDFESAKCWLGGILRKEGSVQKEFGEEALLYL
ncbi:conserved hypothetical protein [Uncinocarpus reesii 1704]|uniref:Urease accessory protein UreD n=1 Tax=Uncinocarpus reesii (strain UAMH 1704) TaxID=336963 RepID=C4JL58_UNCRE|nr:uncharacterized protein UREG_00393 [Uncinocarpus reesii 1704]EEP75547.1 conserved hypothetical protein [Uncinocarpus reesii 1704]